DRSTRGGLRPQKTMILGGAPGAGKTSFMRQIADNVAKSGIPVGWFAADEESVGIDVRRVQAIGFSREEAEKPSEETLKRVESELLPLPFEIYDVADGWTIETAILDFSAKYPNQARLFCVDSLQTAKTARSTGLEKKAKVDDVVATLKLISRNAATECAVIATSEIPRSAYRSEAAADASDDLAAFKESGDIEYAAHVLVLLRSIAGSDDTIDAREPKNRLGQKLNFLLKFDRETTNFEETFDDPREQAKK